MKWIVQGENSIIAVGPFDSKAAARVYIEEWNESRSSTEPWNPLIIGLISPENT